MSDKLEKMGNTSKRTSRMNRAISFRVWKPQHNRMDYLHRTTYLGGYGIYDQFLGCNDKDAVWMQYTGLKDKNGVEIYEGDILEFDAKEWGSDEDTKWPVQWDEENGAWDTGGGLTTECKTWKRVVGNIYQNPELLNP